MTHRISRRAWLGATAAVALAAGFAGGALAQAKDSLVIAWPPGGGLPGSSDPPGREEIAADVSGERAEIEVAVAVDADGDLEADRTEPGEAHEWNCSLEGLNSGAASVPRRIDSCT